MQPLSADIITYVAFDKFIPRVFNCFAYNQKISSPLIVSYLLVLPKH